MAIDNNLHVDMTSKEIREFLLSPEPEYLSQIDRGYLTLIGMEFSDERILTNKPLETQGFTYVVRRYQILDGIMIVGDASVTITIQHFVDVTFRPYLAVSGSLSEEQKATARALFLAYDPASGISLDDYAGTKSIETGISLSKFKIGWRTFIRKKRQTPYTAEDDNLHQYIASLEKGLSLVSISDRETIDPSPPQTHPNRIEAPGNAFGEIEHKVREDAQKSDCKENIQVDITELARIPWFPETETRTQCHWEYWCGIATTEVCYPTLWTRKMENVLYSSVYYPKGSTFLQIIQHCVIAAGLSSAVIGIVTSNFGAAVSAFNALFVECVRQHALDSLQCVKADIYLAVEPDHSDGQWHRAL